MTSKVELLLKEALSMTSSERALIARYLIASIDESVDEDVEKEWIELAKKRLLELKSGAVQPVSWIELKQRIRAS